MSTQPDPQMGREVVFLKVLEDVTSRVRMGKERYGHYLETHNGRDSLQDAYEEAIDHVIYLAQCIMEGKIGIDSRQALFTFCPPRAKFIAQDANGMIYWFSSAPTLIQDMSKWDDLCGGYSGIVYIDENWEQSLIARATP